MRYIVFDTETTGLDPFSGDKIIEIGAIEMINNQRTKNIYHELINPERSIPKEVVEITHITDEMLQGKHTFKEAVPGFLAFLHKDNNIENKPTLVAHNASFDLKFLNYQLRQEGYDDLSEFKIIDTLDLARSRFPGQKATLDMLCERYGISLEARKKEGHGALLDSQILADVFIKLMNDAKSLQMSDTVDFVGFSKQTVRLKTRHYPLTEEEENLHIQFLKENNLI